MTAAFAWGLIAGSPLVLGGWVSSRVRIPGSIVGLVMAFGAGMMISAVAYELTGEAFRVAGGGVSVGAGFFAGALVFFAGDVVIDRYGGHDRKRSHGLQDTGTPLAIVLGIVLDGVPESIVIGVTLLGDSAVSVPVIVAVFLSNIAESIAATTGLLIAGWSARSLLELWSVITLVTGLASLAGYALLGDASPATIAFVLAFAGGAILVMLADTMMPEAYGHGGKLTGLVTAVGFALAFALTRIG